MKKFKWVASCNDGAFEDESRELFATKQECYNDMRNHALEKMKWNTDYDYDFESEEDDYIHYNVTFGQNKITHESYSGVYIYKIVEIDNQPMKTLELTKENCDMIADALKNNIAMWEDHNKVIAMHGVDAQFQKYIDNNNIKIGELKTLLDYINS